MRTRPLLLAAVAALLACATARPKAPGPSNPPPAPAAAAPLVTPGLDAAAVRKRLGEPARVERVPSSAAAGATYERWRYPDREVVFLDGKVIDAVP